MRNKKEKGSSASKQPIRERYHAPMITITHSLENVKENFLKDMRNSKNLLAADIVECVKKLYPAFDETLESKCENSKWGVTLRSDAFYEVVRVLFPNKMKEIQRRRNGGHKFTKRIQCRLSDEEYEKLMFFIDRAGYTTVQEWLAVIVKRYIAQEEKHIYTD